MTDRVSVAVVGCSDQKTRIGYDRTTNLAVTLPSTPADQGLPVWSPLLSALNAPMAATRWGVLAAARARTRGDTSARTVSPSARAVHESAHSPQESHQPSSIPGTLLNRPGESGDLLV
jgi:hypothetical protein